MPDKLTMMRDVREKIVEATTLKELKSALLDLIDQELKDMAAGEAALLSEFPGLAKPA